VASSTPLKTRPLAIVTGASSGIGYELALLTAREGFDLIVAADMAGVTPKEVLAEQHRKMAQPGTAKN
jgi:NAD(P)-dependent dehydrogenase (short-subunit alcohol dehydrogenase family)